MDFDQVFHIDWNSLIAPSSSLLEMFVRGTITYWFCLLFTRLFRRGPSENNVTDLLLITMIADAAQNSMANDYKSISEGVVLVGTLVGWNYFLDWLGFRTVIFGKLNSPDPILLVENGRLLRHNMRKVLVSEEELMRILREEGVEDVSLVKNCYFEGSGNVSVIQKEVKSVPNP